jgi:uncharacterized SAM-binding protein YcdF (DUF218 family)
MTFTLSKLLWVFFTPSNLLVLLLLLGAFLAVAQRDTWRRLGRRLCFGVALIFFLIAALPVGEWVMAPLENRFPATQPDKVDGIILIGGDEKELLTAARGMPIAPMSASDYIQFAALARQYPKAKLVFSGGSGLVLPTGVMPAEIAQKILLNLGVPLERIVFENQSRTTYENAMNTAALVHPTPQQKWLLVTGAFHMPRTVACFRKAGWNVLAMPDNYMTLGKTPSRLQLSLSRNMLVLDLAAHEYVGLVMYRLLGYTDALWPS